MIDKGNGDRPDNLNKGNGDRPDNLRNYDWYYDDGDDFITNCKKLALDKIGAPVKFLFLLLFYCLYLNLIFTLGESKLVTNALTISSETIDHEKYETQETMKPSVSETTNFNTDDEILNTYTVEQYKDGIKITVDGRKSTVYIDNEDVGFVLDFFKSVKLDK